MAHIIVVPYVLNVSHVWGNILYDVNEFYIFKQELQHSPNRLSAENRRYINCDIYTEP